MKKVLFALSALVVLTTSCGKDDKDEPSTVTPTTENLIGSYKITKMEAVINGQSNEITNNPDWSDPCERDDIHKLNANNVYQWVDAGVVCDPPGDYESEWSLINSTTIVIDGETLIIKSFNGKTLQLSDDYNGAEVITTLTKQ